MKTVRMILCFGMAVALPAWSQILTSIPLFPTAEDTITIIYDARQGNRELMGAAEVYAHTGVITNLSANSTSWRYVKTAWNVNSAATRLESLGDDKWSIRFHIRSYYGVPVSEKILALAFVFRNANSSRAGRSETGGDIFLPIYEQGLQITLLQPQGSFVFLQPGDSLAILASAAYAVQMSLFIDDVLIHQVQDDSLSYLWHPSDKGRKRIRLSAQDAGGSVKSLSLNAIVHQLQQSAPLPAGAVDGISYPTSSSATLVLYAPKKEFVYLLGDFNDWQPLPEYQMNRTDDGLRYWLTVTGLQPGKEYIFQYLVDGKLRIADPYTEKISDPWNDSAIDAITYPGLLLYPVDKTTEIAAVLQPEAPAYSWHSASFPKPQKTDLVIYELLLRDFSSRHDFRTLADTLNYLHRLGVNAVELMPIMEFEGNSSWGYNPSFYFAVDKYYGRKEELQRFIDLAHQRGIAVILDLVLNHSYGQSPLVRLYASAMEQNPWYNATSPNPVYAWGYDLNHESVATQNFVDRVTSFWLQQFHVDGFRLDFSKGFTNTPGDGWAYDPARIVILKRIADHIWSIDPQAYVILEHFTDNAEEGVLADYGMMLWNNMNAKFNEATMGYHSEGKSNITAASYQARGWGKPHLLSYMESHDEERLMFKNLQYGNRSAGYSVKDTATALRRIEAAAALFFSIPGPKMIWQFGELGYDYSINYNGRLGVKPLRWDYLQDPRRRHLHQVMAALIQLKIDHPAFETNDYSLWDGGAVKRLNLNHAYANVTVIGNFDVVPANIDPSFQHVGWWYDYFSGDSVRVLNVHTPLALSPGDYRLYADKKWKMGEPATAVAQAAQDPPISFQLRQNFPNPFNQETRIPFVLMRSSQVRMDVYNLHGARIRTLYQGFLQRGEHQFSWDGREDTGKVVGSGIYFLQLHAAEGEQKIRMLLLR